jgi:hypothetical protein
VVFDQRGHWSEILHFNNHFRRKKDARSQNSLRPKVQSSSGTSINKGTQRQIPHFRDLAFWKVLWSEIYLKSQSKSEPLKAVDMHGQICHFGRLTLRRFVVLCTLEYSKPEVLKLISTVQINRPRGGRSCKVGFYYVLDFY